MSKKQISKEDYLKNIHAQINELIKNNKLTLAKKMISDHLETVHEKGVLRSQLVSCFLKEKDYNSALETLKSSPEEYVFLQMLSIYIKIGAEEKIFELYQKYYQTPLENHNEYIKNHYLYYNLLGIYLKSKYEPNYQLTAHEQEIYMIRQINQYSAEATIDFIKTNYCQETTTKNKYFLDTINIDQLFNKVKKYILEHPNEGEIYNYIAEHYQFYYPHCGETIDGEVLDVIEVRVIIGSQNIFSIFPNTFDTKCQVISFETIEKETGVQKPVTKTRKPRSGLERFNQKYGLTGNN